MKQRVFFGALALLLCLGSGMLYSEGQQEAEIDPLDVYVFSGPIVKEFWEASIDEYTGRYPDQGTELVAIPKVSDMVRTRLASGDPPDLYFSAGAGRLTVAQLVAEDLLLPLDSLLNEKDWNGDASFGDSIMPGRLKVLDGKTWGIQVPFHLVGFFYHEPTFREHGWDVPSNFAEFQELAPKIKEAGMAPMVTTGIHTYYFEQFVLRGAVASGGGAQALLDWKNHKPGFFTSDLFRTAVEKLEWLVENGYMMDGAAGMNHTISQSEWIHGKAAFLPCGTWLESEMKNDFPEGWADGIRFVPSFFIDEGKEMVLTPYGDAAITIMKGANEEAAGEYLKALFSPEVMSQMTEMTNILSNVPKANDIAEKSPAIESAIAWSEELKSLPWPEGGYASQDVYAVIDAQLQGMLNGRVTAEELCQAAEKAAEQVRQDDSVVFFEAYFPE